MTESDTKTTIGIWVLLNAIWVVSFIVTIIRCVLYFIKNKKPFRFGYFLSRWDKSDGALFGIDVIMFAMWLLIALIEAGEWISTLIF